MRWKCLLYAYIASMFANIAIANRLLSIPEYSPRHSLRPLSTKVRITQCYMCILYRQPISVIKQITSSYLYQEPLNIGPALVHRSKTCYQYW